MGNGDVVGCCTCVQYAVNLCNITMSSLSGEKHY